MSKRINIFNIPLSCSFWDTLADIYLKKYENDDIGLASVLFLLPNRRACQSLIAAFVRQKGLRPAILPEIVPLAELDDDELFFSSFSQDMAAINKKFDKIDEKFNKIDQKFDKIDEKFEKLNDKIDGFAKYMQTLTVTTVIGIAAIAVSVIVFVAKS